MRLEHTETIVSSGYAGRRPVLSVGSASSSNRIARISASSSTRRGRGDSMIHRKSRCAYSRFSSSIPNRVRLYVSSNVFGKSSKTFRMLAGRVRRSLSTWQTIQRNLRDHVSVRREGYDQRTRHAITYMPFTLLDRPDSVSTTSCLSSLFHLRMLQSEWTIGPRGHRNLT